MAKRFPERGGQQSGFTLVELMVVIVVLGIVAAAVVPRMHGGIETARVGSAARKTADVMAFASQNAIATGRVHALVIETEGRRMYLLAEPSTLEDEDFDHLRRLVGPPELEPVSIPGMRDMRLPEGVRIASFLHSETDIAGLEEGGVRVLFFPDGTTEFAWIEVAGEGGEARMIALNGVSGTTRIDAVELEAGE